MLTHTFVHIPGIGAVTEKNLWDQDLWSWSDLDRLDSSTVSHAKRMDIEKWIDTSKEHLTSNHPQFFETHLPANQHYRFFPEFKDSCAYLDIETTGLETHAVITTIALYDGKQIKYYIQGQNLSQFITDIDAYSVLITYNGRTFDIPFIEQYFNIRLEQAQIDLRYILGHLGFKGGLKKCEKALGINRSELEGVDGYFAVLLWRYYQRTGNRKALETLLAYNIEDVVNLETLMVKAYNLNIRNMNIDGLSELEVPPKPLNPFSPDQQVIDEIMRTYY